MTFEKITGHQQQKKILSYALEQHRVAHAYLFEGPEGIGKRLIAIAFARALLCQNRNGCGDCSACLKVDNGSHPDIHRLNAEDESIKIEHIRTLQRALSMRPLESSFKVCLLDGVEHLTTNAANALLKTLEEPQPGTLIILLTKQPEILLPTIRSRCQRIPFLPLTKQQLATVLAKKLNLCAAEATTLAALSAGSLKKALGSNQELFLKRRIKLIQSLSSLSPGSIIPTFALAEELEKDKDILIDILDIFQSFYRDLLLLKHNRPETELVNQDLIQGLQQQKHISTTSLLLKLKALETTHLHLQRNVNRRLALEVMLLRITTA